MKTFTLNSLDGTKKLAESFASLIKTGDIIALYGTLGVGKTAFTRFLVQSFCGKDEEVPSPTFTLLQTYDTSNFPIFHFDLYRLKKSEEVLELGIEDAFYDGVCLIEWPEKMENLLPQRKILKLEISATGDTRQFSFSSQNDSWNERLERWNATL